MPANLPSHIVLSPNTWNGSELMRCIDGAVTYQRIVEVIDTCQKAGIWNISFATQRPTTEE